MVEILFVPSVRRGNGSGHLARCLGLAARLGSKAAIYLPDDPGQGSWSSGELRLAYPREMASVRVIGELRSESRFRLVVLDNRESSAADLERWWGFGALVAIDEGGEGRSSIPFLVDILPRPWRLSRLGPPPNLSSLGYLALPKARREAPASLRKVLVSFGGEDPAGLADAFMKAALGSGLLRADQITLVAGALSSSLAHFEGVTAIGPVQDLKEKLHCYDLVVTQFGLTAYEAAWAGAAVLLLNPSLVHEELARTAGFVSLGTGKPDTAALRKALRRPETLVEASRKAAPAERLDLAARLDLIHPAHAGACPVCGLYGGTAVHRSERKTYLACSGCSLVRMVHFEPRTNPYVQRAYFFDEYKAQYGRTYIEDIPSIRVAAARRLGIIEGLVSGGHEGKSILDVGCAYGAFVMEAQARGWNAVGSDIAPDAVEYVTSTCRIPAFVADFAAPGADGLYPRELSCLSMWYVIEHFDELGRVLRRAASLLAKGGVLAFSTPSASGISARKNAAVFYENSPDDHYTVWSPGSAQGILKRFGFDVQRVVITGHHPERLAGIPADPRSFRYRAGMAASKLLGLGDTFECYALYRGRSDNTNKG